MKHKIIIHISLLFIFLFSFCKPTLAKSIYFSDSFNNIDSNKWEVFGPEAGVNAGSNTLNLNSIYGVKAPYVRSKINIFPTSGDFELSYKLRYRSLTYYGVGIGVGDSNPDYDLNVNDPISSRIITLWQDQGQPLLGMFNQNYMPSFNMGFDTSQKNIRVTYLNGLYSLYINDALKFESHTQERRAKAIWLGNPRTVGVPDNWTTLSVSELNVYSLTGDKTLSVVQDLGFNSSQLPINREGNILATVKDSSNNPIPNATVSALLNDPSLGSLNQSVGITGEDGVAHFIFTPDKVGAVTVNFSLTGGAVADTVFNVYRPPIVIVPGAGASFNPIKFFALDSDQEHWGWAPTAKGSWDVLLKNFDDLGYVKGTDYDISFYDWRKSVQFNTQLHTQAEAVNKNLAPTINKLLLGRPEGQKVDVLAHSFGGLVTRSYIQDPRNSDLINMFITMGTPHQGSSSIYYIWEGASIAPIGDSLIRAMVWALGVIYSHPTPLRFNNMSTFHQTFAGLQDLLPTYASYLFRNSIFTVPTDQMHYLNTTLATTMPLSDFKNKVAAKNIAFTSIYAVGAPSIRDINTVAQPLGSDRWEDGKPVSFTPTNDGDDSVMKESASVAGLTTIQIAGHHYFEPNNSISYIQSLLKIPNTVNTTTTPRYPDSLFLLVLSPAYPELYDSSNKLVSTALAWEDSKAKVAYAAQLLPDVYTAKITGTGKGEYTFNYGYAGETAWSENEFKGSTKVGQVDAYQIFIDPVHGQPATSVVQTKMQLHGSLAEILKGKLIVKFSLDIPKNFDANVLHLQHAWLNNSYLDVVDSQVTKNTLIVTLRLKDVAHTLNWNERDLDLSLLLAGTHQSLMGFKNVKIPWGLYKKQLEQER
jgi:pimeloyl-ACP methyl ester carboxylesterase